MIGKVVRVKDEGGKVVITVEELLHPGLTEEVVLQRTAEAREIVEGDCMWLNGDEARWTPMFEGRAARLRSWIPIPTEEKE